MYSGFPFPLFLARRRLWANPKHMPCKRLGLEGFVCRPVRPLLVFNVSILLLCALVRVNHSWSSERDQLYLDSLRILTSLTFFNLRSLLVSLIGAVEFSVRSISLLMLSLFLLSCSAVLLLSLLIRYFSIQYTNILISCSSSGCSSIDLPDIRKSMQTFRSGFLFGLPNKLRSSC